MSTDGKVRSDGGTAQGGIVSRLLSHGRENPITGAVLVRLLGLKDLRELTQLIERERRAGVPICAATDASNPGYYLADGPSELETYLDSLDRRLRNIGQTRRHLGDTLLRMVGQEKIGGC